MRYLHAAAAVAALVSIGPGRADAAANLTVTVSNIGTGAGRVLMAVCPEDAFLTPACPYFAAEPAAPGAVTLRIAVDPGLVLPCMGGQGETCGQQDGGEHQAGEGHRSLPWCFKGIRVPARTRSPVAGKNKPRRLATPGSDLELLRRLAYAVAWSFASGNS